MSDPRQPPPRALFLVKYVDTFKATPRNLTVLVYDRFGL